MSMISKHFKIMQRRLGRILLGRNPFDMAYFFCKGSGLEVGARNNPYPFSSKCSVAYADLATETIIKMFCRKVLRLSPP
jgi:hypothetical protein